MNQDAQAERRQPSITERELCERLAWFIELRWFAAAGVLVMFLVSRYFLDIHFPSVPIFCIVAAMLCYNMAFQLYSVRTRPCETVNLRDIEIFANVQISVDLLVLTVLIHFSGGLENPFAVFYMFHMIIASILLPRRDCYLQATIASVLLNGLALLEYTGALRHVPLEGFLPVDLYNRGLFVLSECSAYTLTFFLTIYMATSITERLRAREKEIERTNLELMSIHEARSEVMRKIHHELRAPLAAIQSCLKLMLDGYTGELT